MTHSARAAEILNDAIRLPAEWSWEAPAGALVHLDDWHPLTEHAGYLEQPPPSDADPIVAYLTGPAAIEMRGDVDLSAAEAGIEIAPALARVLDTAVAAARHFTLPPPAAHRAGEIIRDLRAALRDLGYLESETRP